MAVYKIFPTKDATLYSLYPSMNTGLDAILEISNVQNLELKPDVARYLIEFDTDEIIDTIDNKISGKEFDVFLRNYIATAQGINADVELEIFATAQSWNNGTGHYLDVPEVNDGVSWKFRDFLSVYSWEMSGNVG